MIQEREREIGLHEELARGVRKRKGNLVVFSAKVSTEMTSVSPT